MTCILPGGLGQLGGGFGGSTFDPTTLGSYSSTPGSLTNNNKMLNGPPGPLPANEGAAACFGKNSHNSGKYYFEMVINNIGAAIVSAGAGGYTSAGVLDPGAYANGSALGSWVGQSSTGFDWGIVPYSYDGLHMHWQWYNNDSNSWTLSANANNGDIIGVAVDFSGTYIDFAVNGVWGGSNASTPIPTGTYSYITTAGRTLVPVGSAFSLTSLAQMTIRTAAPFSYAVPSGYVAWG